MMHRPTPVISGEEFFKKLKAFGQDKSENHYEGQVAGEFNITIQDNETMIFDHFVLRTKISNPRVNITFTKKLVFFKIESPISLNVTFRREEPLDIPGIRGFTKNIRGKMGRDLLFMFSVA